MKLTKLDGFFSLLLVILVAVSFGAFAQDVPAPTFLDGLLKFLADNGGVVSSILAFAVEMVLRLFPSAAPLSLLVPVKYVLNGLVVVLQWLAGVLDAVINAANNVKPPALK